MWVFPKGFLINWLAKPFPYPFLLSTLELSKVLIELSPLYWPGPGLSFSCSKNLTFETPNAYWLFVLYIIVSNFDGIVPVDIFDVAS